MINSHFVTHTISLQIVRRISINRLTWKRVDNKLVNGIINSHFVTNAFSLEIVRRIIIKRLTWKRIDITS